MKPFASSPQNLRIEMKNHLPAFITSLGITFLSLPECPEGQLDNLPTSLLLWDKDKENVEYLGMDD